MSIKKPLTVPNATSGNMQETHILEIPACCPVSKNPRPGSTLNISYVPAGKSLEVGSLLAYIHSFRGGLKDADGVVIVRDMEGMVKKIAEDCQDALGIPVTVRADLQIVPRQCMVLETGADGRLGDEPKPDQLAIDHSGDDDEH